MPDHTTDAAGRAVFLSYAREDAEAARRIAEALRSAGVEVWFDANELRGGDAWDAHIRQKIRECDLFIPIVSAQTQARAEGYFRREWKLADERTADMGRRRAFLVPVCIDGTKDGEADVPDSFLKVQWTRLPGALPTPEFVAQVKKLLEVQMEAGRPRPAERGEGTAPPKKSLSPVVLLGAAGVIAVAVATIVIVSRRPATPPIAAGAETPRAEMKPAAPPVAAQDPKAQTPDPSRPPLAEAKSIAVLPFANMSEEKDNAFFADGVHEDVLTNLALIRELRVVSRTSVLGYRGTTKPMKQIAEELGVTFILEGSVRRFGNKVRVTGQLIHAGTDEHVWAATYDRDLTDIFAIQTELSRQIAAALKTALTPVEEMQIARKRTTNPAAYDHFLRARDIFNREGTTISARDRRILHLRQAVETDPEFAEGWSELATAYAYRAFTFEAGMDDYLALAKSAIERAELLAPTDPEVRRNIGTFHYYGHRDYERALQEYRRIAQEQPNDPPTMNSLALILRRQGKWAESLGYARRAAELDPANITYARNLRSSLVAGRRWDEARAVQRRIAALLPDEPDEAFYVALHQFLADGSTREGDAFFAQLDEATRNSPRLIELRRDWAATKGDLTEAARLDRLQPYFDGDGTPRHEQDFFAAHILFQLGDREGAVRRLGDSPRWLREQLEREPRNPRFLSFLADMESIAGNKQEALRLIARCCELLPFERDALDAPRYQAIRAAILAQSGETERALEEYRRALRIPNTNFQVVNVHVLRARTPAWAPLRGDPRFEALLADPKNNAPLF